MTQKERRQYRALLGLCLHCQEPRANGLSRCEKHNAEHMATDHARREREKVARGYRYERVPTQGGSQ